MLAVVELILQKSKLLRGNHFHSHSIFELPLALQAYNSLVDVGSHVWMYIKCEMLDSNFVDQVIDLSLQLISEQNA